MHCHQGFGGGGLVLFFVLFWLVWLFLTQPKPKELYL